MLIDTILYNYGMGIISLSSLLKFRLSVHQVDYYIYRNQNCLQLALIVVF